MDEATDKAVKEWKEAIFGTMNVTMNEVHEARRLKLSTIEYIRRRQKVFAYGGPVGPVEYSREWLAEEILKMDEPDEG